MTALVRFPQFLARTPFVSEKESQTGAIAMIILAAVYSCLTLGPWFPTMKAIIVPGQIAERAQIADKMLSRIPEDASVVAGYGLLPALSSREELYSLHYKFLGVSQYALSPYKLPEEVRFMAVDTEDFLTYAAQFPNTGWSAPYYDGGFSRLRNYAGARSFNLGHFQLYDRLNGSYRVQSLPAVSSLGSHKMSNGLEMSHGSALVIRDLEDGFWILEVMTGWGMKTTTEDDWQMSLRLIDQSGELVWERIYPFGNGLVSATELTARPLGTKIRAPLSGLSPGRYRVQMLVKRQEATVCLDRLDSVSLWPSSWQTVGTVSLQ